MGTTLTCLLLFNTLGEIRHPDLWLVARTIGARPRTIGARP